MDETPHPRGTGEDVVLPPVLGLINDPDHPLAARIQVNVVDLDGLVVAPAIPMECLEQFILQFEQLDGVAAIDIDEVVAHVVLALAQEAQTRQAGCDDLHGNQSFHL